MGPLAGALIPAGAGLIGSLIGSGQQSHANDAANQAAQGQNQINQELMGIYNQILTLFNQNYAPLQQPLTGQLGQTLSGAGAQVPGDISSYLSALMDPSQVAKITGIDSTGAAAGAFGQLTGAGASAGSDIQKALAYYMNPQGTNASSAFGQTQDIFNNNVLPAQFNAWATAQQAPATAQSGISAEQGALGAIDPLVNYGNSALSGPVAQQSGQTLDYLKDPNATKLSGAFPGIESLLSSTMQHGMDPNLISQALHQNDIQSQQQLSTIRNQMGAGLPNEAGTIKDITGQEFASNADLLAKMTGQSQGLELSAAQGLQGAAGGLDSQTMSMLTSALSSAGYTQDQIMQMFQGAASGAQAQAGIGQGIVSGAGTLGNLAMDQSSIANNIMSNTTQMGNQAMSLDQQIAQMLGLGTNLSTGSLMQGVGLGQQTNQGQIGNMGSAATTGMSMDQLIQQIISSGYGPMGSATSGLQGIGQQYAQAGANAANSAGSSNPFGNFATLLGGLNWGGSKSTGNGFMGTGLTQMQPGQLT